MNKILREVCVEGYTEAALAFSKGADRIELCENLYVGGTSPSYGTIGYTVEKLNIPIAVMVRPRGGNFEYSEDEKHIMKTDVAICEQLKASAIVLGALKGRKLDIDFLSEIRECSKNSELVCHMCFDDTDNYEESLEALIKIGFNRILTKGGSGSAPENIPMLKRLVELAGDKITVMPGKSVTLDNYLHIIKATGAKEIHGSKIV